MTKRSHFRAVLDVVTQAVTPHGLTCRRVEGGKHPAIMVEGAGRRMKVTVSSTPRDSDCQVIQHRQRIVAWLKREGLI